MKASANHVVQNWCHVTPANDAAGPVHCVSHHSVLYDKGHNDEGDELKE